MSDGTKVYVCCTKPECRKAFASVVLPPDRTAEDLAAGYNGRAPVRCAHCNGRGPVEIRESWEVPATPAS